MSSYYVTYLQDLGQVKHLPICPTLIIILSFDIAPFPYKHAQTLQVDSKKLVIPCSINIQQDKFSLFYETKFLRQRGQQGLDLTL